MVCHSDCKHCQQKDDSCHTEYIQKIFNNHFSKLLLGGNLVRMILFEPYLKSQQCLGIRDFYDKNLSFTKNCQIHEN